jgi:hypothetical protein
VSDVASRLRQETLAADRALSALGRLERALLLGEDDVAFHAAARGLEPGAARLALRRQRAAGRRPSPCAAER